MDCHASGTRRTKFKKKNVNLNHNVQKTENLIMNREGM